MRVAESENDREMKSTDLIENTLVPFRETNRTLDSQVAIYE